MLRTSLCLLSLTVVLALALGCGHNRDVPKPAPAKGKQASTPEEAVAFLLEASKADNRDDYYEQLALVYRQNREAKGRLKQAAQVFELILAKKFGASAVPDKPAESIALDWDPNVISIAAAEVIAKEPQKDDTFLLHVKVKSKFAMVGGNVGEPAKIVDEDSEERFTAVHEGGVWKLIPLIKLSGRIGGAIGGGAPAKPTETMYEVPDLKAMADEAVLADKMTTATDQLTKEMEAGKYTSAKEAQETRDKKIREILATAAKKTVAVDQAIGVRVGAPPPAKKGGSPAEKP